jgi:type IV secretory pathway TraG/TraD family ATPase VirD4
MKDTNLIIGKTNTGKTRGILFKEVRKIIEKKENLFILDKRGEYFKTFGNKLDGYNKYIINLDDASKSNGYNPLLLPYNLYKANKKDKCIELLKNLTLEIFKDENLNSDPFWSNSAADYITGLILVLFKEAKEEEINLGSIGTLLNQIQIKVEDTTLFKKYLKTIEITDPIYKLSSTTEFAPNETKGSIISVIRQKLNNYYIKENLLKMLSTNELNLTNLNEKTAIIVIGNNDIANILLDQLYYQINENKIKFNFILDNLDNYSRVLSLKEIIEDATYNNIKVTVAIRDLEEIESKYGKYIFNKFQNIITIDDSLELMELGDYNIYPETKEINRNYFDFEKFVNENIK